MMIYTRTEHSILDYEKAPDRVRILHDNWDSINAQIAETLERMIPANLDNDGYVHWDKYEIEKWNDMGYEWRIEEMYAEGAMMSELVHSDFVQTIKRLYEYPATPRGEMTKGAYYGGFTNEEYTALEKESHKKFPTTYLHRFTTHDDYEVNEVNQERARKAVKMMFAMCDYLRNGARPPHHSWRVGMRHWKTYESSGALNDPTIHFMFTGLSDPAYFNTEMFNGHNITFKDFQRAKHDAEYKAHLAYMETPKGKAEEEARQQAEADLATYMGENGFNSYADNGDGTISTWRE